MAARRAFAVLYVSLFAVAVIVSAPAGAQTPSVPTAISWLNGQQRGNGSWGTLPEFTPRDTARAVIAETLHKQSGANLSTALAWLGSQNALAANEFIAEQAIAVALGNGNAAPFLLRLSQQRSTTGPDYGGFAEYNGNSYDSALAIQALATSEATWTAAIGGALTTVLVRQNADGGWGLDQGFDSNPVVTAEVLMALSALEIQQPPPVVIAAAQSYLARLMRPDGSIGTGVLETAVAYRALALSGYSLSGTSATTMQYLGSQQQANGSWGADTYLTARVLEAIAANKTNLTIKPGDFTLTPASVADGATVTAKVIVSNIGAAASTSIPVNIYSSESKTRLLAAGTVGALAVGASQTVNINFVASNLTGQQTVVAVVDPNGTLEEMREDDNERTAVLLVDAKPDLQVFSTDIVTSPSRLQPDQPATLSVTVRNSGEGDALNVGYAIYDTPAGAAETLLKKDSIASLPPGTSTVISLPIAFAAGTHTVRASVDPDKTIAETSETNNDASRSLAIVPVSRVDLRIGPADVVVTPPRPAAGESISISVRVANTGTDPLQSSVSIYDGFPGTGAVIGVFPVTIDAQSTQNVQATYTTTANTRVIYAVADPANTLQEIDEANNSAFAALTDQFADLLVTREGVVLPKIIPSNNQQLAARVVVRNNGTLDATGVQVVIYDDLPQIGGKKIVDTTVDVPAQGKVVVPATWPARAGQRFATVEINPSRAVFEADYTNNRITRAYNVNSNDIDVALSGQRSTAIDVSRLVVNPSELTVSGIVRAEVTFPSTKSVTVLLFEDVDGDRAYNPEADRDLGSTLVPAGFSPQSVQITAEGTLRFAPGKLLLYLDSTGAVSESNESNNFVDIWQDCQITTDSVLPGVKWSNGAPGVALSPVARIIDTNGDDVLDANDLPHIVQTSGSTVSLLRGTDGRVVWSQTFGFTGRQIAPVIADVDNNGRPEILVHEDTHKIVALNGDGTRKWTSPELERDPKWDAFGSFVQYSYAGAPAVADLDNDGKPEVIVGRTCLNGANGTVKWVGTGGAGRAWYTGDDRLYMEAFPDQEAPIAVDLGTDGRLEVVAGNTAYRADGTILWQRSDLPDGYTSPVVRSGQSLPSICLVSQGRIWLLNPADGSTVWGPVNIPGGALLGGAPTIFSDGGGGPWIGVAGDGFYSVLNASTGAVRWSKQTTTNLSFGITTTNAATAFDFGAGMSLVFAARDKLIIYRSTDGLIFYSTPIVQHQYYPMVPAVADVDDDGRADIVTPGTGGLKILSDPTWNGAPAVFNQFSYHVINVSNELAGIPNREFPTTFTRTHYRMNQATAFTATPIANLTGSYMRADTNGYPANVILTARIGNNGWSAAPASSVAFYRLNANNTSTLLGTAPAPALLPGEYNDVSFTLLNPTGGTFTFYAVADSNGSTGAIGECNENDNRAPNVSVRFSADILVDQALLLVTDPQPRPGETITFSAIAQLSGAVDTSALTAQFFLGAPPSGTPISGALQPQITSVRLQKRAEVTLPWVVTTAPGPQSVYVVFDVANAIVEDDENNNTGVYALQVSTAEPIFKLSGSTTLTPPSAEAGTAIAVDVLLQNSGNVALQNTVINYTVTGGAGTGFTGSATITALAKYDFASLRLGTFTPSANGTYTVTITPADPNVTVITDTKTIEIAPFAGAQMTALPARVPTTLPLVQCHTTINRQNTIVVADDPIIALIKTHIQRGLNWQGPVLNSAMASNCYKCHVQSQGMVSFESARDVSGVTFDLAVEQKLYTQTVQFQKADGHFGDSGGPITTAALGAWSLSYWFDPQQAKPYLVKALDLLVSRQRTDGAWDCDFCSLSFENREATTMMAMIGMARGYDVTKDPRYLTSLIKASNWAVAYDYASTRTTGVEKAARVAIALSYALPQIADPGLSNTIRTRIKAITEFLKSAQNADGSFGTQTTPDFPVVRTAQSLYALARAGLPGTDPSLRAAILWLINNQQPNGGWKEESNETNQVTWLDESTWAMIALPAAFGRLGQFDVELKVLLPTATDLVSSNIPPGAIRVVETGRELLWKFPNVTEDGYELLFNVKLNGIANEEKRPATGAAAISYTDPYSGQPVTRSVAAPLITGFAPLTLDVTTDKPVYPASAPVTITETITNLGTTTEAITNDLIIRDANGLTVATIASNDPVPGLPVRGFPGWHFAIPFSTTITRDGTDRRLAFSVDFAQSLSALGVTGTFDRNSIRVSADSAPTQELRYAYGASDATGARGTISIAVPDSVANGATFAGQLFFDIVENGFKPASLFDLRHSAGTANGLVARYYYLDNTRSLPNSSTPAGLVYSGGPVSTITLPTTNLAPPPRNDYWASEWTGALMVPATGSYQLRIGSDDGSWLYIDDQLVLQLPGVHGTIETSTTRTLTAGFHTIKFIVFNWTSGYAGYIKWAPPGQSLNFIPNANLAPSLPATSGITVGAAVALPDGTTTRTYNWNTGTTAAGPYTAVGTLKQFATFVANDSAAFAISPAAEVTGTIATDKTTYDAGETVRVNASVHYTAGNTTLTNLTAKLTIVSPAGTALASQTTPIASLLPAQTVPVRLDWPAGTSAAGTYRAALQVTDDKSTVLVDQSVPFDIRPTSQSGRGISGTISTAATIYQGEPLAISTTVTNGGNSALTDAPFEVRLIDPVTDTLVASIPFTASVDVGATRPVQLSYPATAQLKVQTYAAWLVSMISGAAVPLANTTFQVSTPPLKLELSAGGPARVLIWANCTSGNNTDPCSPVAPPFLTKSLTDAGIPWTLVGDQYSFMDRMRTGAYSAAILYQPSAFEAKISAEYLETIRSGFGLIFITNRSDADPKLQPALGVDYRGRIGATTTLLDVVDTPFTTAGQLAMNGDTLAVEVRTALAAARVGATRAPAIAYHTYGAGRTITIPFDTELTPAAPVATLLVNGVKFVSRTPTTDARQVVPIDFKVTPPPGAPADLTIAAQLPAGMTVVFAQPALAAGTANPTWNVSAAGSEFHLYLWVRLPEAIGSHEVVGTAAFSGQLPVVTKSLTLQVTADRAAIETALAASLTALAAAAPSTDQSAISAATTELAALRAAAPADTVSTAAVVTRVLNLITILQSISIDTTAARGDADRLLVYWQSRIAG